MRWSYVLWLPFLGGCLAPGALPDSSPKGDHSSSSVHIQDPGGKTSPGDENTPLWALANPYGSDFSLLDNAYLTTSGHEDESISLPDPETLEDNRILSGAGEAPPTDEGKTVPADEVVFDFPVVENEKVTYYIDYFTGPARSTFARWMERSGRYIPMMQEIFREEGLPEDLVYLSMVESGFNVRAYSWAHAVGLWQFIASTGKMYGLNNDYWREERRDFEKSTRAAAKFLKYLHARYDGDWYLAVAAYNCGPGRIDQAVRKFKTRDFWEISRKKFLPAETKNYVPKLLAALIISKQAEKYGFVDLDYHPPVEYDLVNIPTPTDLEVVAKLCEVSYDDVKELNPELRRWCTPPGVENYKLRIPAGKKDVFEEKYAQVPSAGRANYALHKVKKGDTLLALAYRYNVRVEDIMSFNKIRNPKALRIGADLILPLKKGVTALPPGAGGTDDYDRTYRQTYSVRKGDTLWDISRKFNVSEKELRVWNRLGWKNIIRPGQKLIVSSRAASKSVVSSKTGKTVYTVQSGDNLWTIAKKFKVSTSQLTAWNRLSKGQLIHPGDTLVVAEKGSGGKRKITYQVKAGDTLWDIGRKYDVATREIMDLNDLDENTILQPGDQLTLLVTGGSQG